MSTEADAARAAVLARYPDATLQRPAFWFRIWADGRCLNVDFMNSPDLAWIDAAKRLPTAEGRS